MGSKATMDKIVSLAKRRGFVFQSSEIYGGLSSAWDYGPMGVELKRRIQDFWWREMTQLHDNIVGLDAAIMMHPRVWEASGHVEGFVDLMVEDTVTNERYRWDHLTDEERAVEKEPQGQPADGAAQVQPDVQDPPRPGGGCRLDRLPEARDGPGHLRQLQERAADEPRKDALRHRPGRQGLPQRDRHQELHLPDLRVRADGDAVLRAARARATSGSTTGRSSAWPTTPSWASTRASCASTSTGPTSWRTTPRTPTTSSTSSPWAGRSSRACTTAPTSTSSATASTAARTRATSTRRPRSATSPTSSRPPRGSRAAC